jgi:replication factor C subunit 1
MSTVRPASLIYGGGNPSLGGGGWQGPSFPSWLGQNSKQTKLSRMLGDIQIRMRLKVSGDKGEIRLNYMPTLASKLILPIMKDGQVRWCWMDGRR